MNKEQTNDAFDQIIAPLDGLGDDILRHNIPFGVVGIMTELDIEKFSAPTASDAPDTFSWIEADEADGPDDKDTSRD
jgi:hypothetical protein